jgi:uncharacterized OsmC-like protein
MRNKLSTAMLLVALTGCTSEQVQNARDGFHKASSAALGLVTAALENPELVEEAKVAIKAAADQADPKKAAEINAAIDHVNAGNLAKAKAILATAVKDSAPAAADANTARSQ